MSNEFDRIYNKIEKVENILLDTRMQQAKMFSYVRQNTQDLSKHIKRTNLLEDFMKHHVEDTSKHKAPLTVAEVLKASAKFIIAMAALSATIYTIYNIYGVFNG